MTTVSTHPKHFLSDKVEHFTESVIREMTRQAMQYGAVNLAQGFPDFPAPAEIKRAAQEAIAGDVNQYAITWGAKSLRNAIARQMRERQGIEVDPEKEIVVCCGSTEAMIATLLAICNKGDEVIVFEPFYENYGPDAILSGAKPRFVSLRPPHKPGGEWTFDEQELREAFRQERPTQAYPSRTKAIIVNTPNNPTGKVFSRKELELIRDFALNTTCWRSPTRSTSTFFTMGRSTFLWRGWRACANGRSLSTGFPKATALRDGAWDGRLRLRR